MTPERPSPASSDDTQATVSDEHHNAPSSPSISFDSAPESDASASASSSRASSGSSASDSDSEPVVARKPRPPVRSWPASEEIALLEAVASHRQSHGRLPSPQELFAALRGRLRGDRADDRLGPEQVARRLHALRSRYDKAAIRLARGTIPAKDDDVTIYRLSKLVWAGARRGKRPRKDRAADARKDPRAFRELAQLYPCLAAEVEAIDAECGATAPRAFGHIGDDTAARLEAKVKKQWVAEARASAERDRLRRNVANTLLGLIK
ncbi:hypothetical protein BS78_10G273800 [Paspalum vaginatum]|nr:hypothetical protein BS78_10G273800 [Paspalum vaginatum]